MVVYWLAWKVTITENMSKIFFCPIWKIDNVFCNYVFHNLPSLSIICHITRLFAQWRKVLFRKLKLSLLKNISCKRWGRENYISTAAYWDKCCLKIEGIEHVESWSTEAKIAPKYTFNSGRDLVIIFLRFPFTFKPYHVRIF